MESVSLLGIKIVCVISWTLKLLTLYLCNKLLIGRNNCKDILSIYLIKIRK